MSLGVGGGCHECLCAALPAFLKAFLLLFLFLLFNRYEQRRSGSAGNEVFVKAGRAILGLRRSPRGNHCVASGSHSRTLKIYIALPPQALQSLKGFSPCTSLVAGTPGRAIWKTTIIIGPPKAKMCFLESYAVSFTENLTDTPTSCHERLSMVFFL